MHLPFWWVLCWMQLYSWLYVWGYFDLGKDRYINNTALPALHRAAACFCDQSAGVPWLITGWNESGDNSSIASATLAGNSQSNWWVTFLKWIWLDVVMLKIFFLSVVQMTLPNYVCCGSTHQSFVIKFYLFFFLIIKVFSHACLDLSQLFETGQQFFFMEQEHDRH